MFSIAVPSLRDAGLHIPIPFDFAFTPRHFSEARVTGFRDETHFQFLCSPFIPADDRPIFDAEYPLYRLNLRVMGVDTHVYVSRWYYENVSAGQKIPVNFRIGRFSGAIKAEIVE